MDWSSELVVFAHLKGENLGLSLPDLGSQQLSEGQWCVLSGTTARAFLNDGSDCSLNIWILSKKLLSKIVNDLDLASCALDCFACPAVSLPVFIKGDADHSLSMTVDVLSHVVDKKGSYSPLAVEARVLEGLQSFLEQPTSVGYKTAKKLASQMPIEMLCLKLQSTWLQIWAIITPWLL